MRLICDLCFLIVILTFPCNLLHNVKLKDQSRGSTPLPHWSLFLRWMLHRKLCSNTFVSKYELTLIVTICACARWSTKINAVESDNEPLCCLLSLPLQSVSDSCFPMLSSVVVRNTECSVRSQKNNNTKNPTRTGDMVECQTRREGEGE